MRDYYQDGVDAGYGSNSYNCENDYPKNDGDAYSYKRGVEEGQRRREMAQEIDRDYFGY